MKKALIAVAALLSIVSCGEDRTYEYLEKTEENQWIFSTMKAEYLWADEIKTPERKSFFDSESKFFASLLNAGDKVSYFTDTVQSGSYGLTCAIMRDPLGEKPSKYYALVLFADDNSPAAISGIKRGTWISAIDGKSLSSSSGNQLKSGEAKVIATETIDFDDEAMKYFWTTGDTITLQPSSTYSSNAIHTDTIFNVRSSKIGYIALNNFNGADFASRIENTLLGFEAESATEIILDLRYCNGGSIENAAKAASMLVPSTLKGTPFATLKGNSLHADTVYNYTGATANISDKKLYIVTGKRTRGTAELFAASANASRGRHEVLLIGESSAGEGLMTKRIESPFGFAINPVTAIMSASDENGLEGGILPDYPLDELAEIQHIYPIGNEQEYILRCIEYLIVNGEMP
ncbi:MAG: hypothetical protein IKJ95_07130 [Bacteroidaceae bacterium]|nr:hypothetical protein [Bacteroidaceae bacterium]